MMASVFLCASEIVCFPTGRRLLSLMTIAYTWCHGEANIMTIFLELLLFQA